MFDLFFVTYEEPNADSNWSRVKSKFPHASRIHGITGIANAHQMCAKQSFTKMFWTVDGDTRIDDNWDFSFCPDSWDEQYLHLWYSRNPINDLQYGYGAIKLWPKKLVLNWSGDWLDFTTSVGNIKIVDDTIATTQFNTSPYETWKSAFRECVKLSENLKNNPDDLESKHRLLAWTSKSNNAEYAEWCIIGSMNGVSWYNENSHQLNKINDFSWLRYMFDSYYKL